MRSELPRHGDVIDLPASARAALATLAEHPGIRAVIVFGSRARGDHDPRSDIDVAIDAPGLDSASLARIRDRISEFPTLYRISVTALDAMPDALRHRVLMQGITIHERDEA